MKQTVITNKIKTGTQDEIKYEEQLINKIKTENDFLDYRAKTKYIYNDIKLDIRKFRKYGNDYVLQTVKEYLIFKEINLINYLKEIRATKYTIKDLCITVDHKSTRMYYNNPKAYLKGHMIVKRPNQEPETIFLNSTSSRISGCGYDKLTYALSEAIENCKDLLDLIHKQIMIKADNNLHRGLSLGDEGPKMRLKGIGLNSFLSALETLDINLKDVGSRNSVILLGTEKTYK